MFTHSHQLNMDMQQKSDRISLTWRDLTVFAPLQHDKKSISLTTCCSSVPPKYTKILNNVSGIVHPGMLLAIMGSSGSGKTTLINVLSQRWTKGLIVDGHVYFNDRSMHEGVNTEQIGFVYQDDLFFATITVKEHLTFMAKLKLSKVLTSKEIERRVEALLTEMGLKQCEATKIGSIQTGQGISGGEKKRLAFATEILTDPPILFCDEPTTGLDAFMAQNVVKVLQSMATNGKTVICTIHQPSSEVFSMFNTLLLLTDGRLAFYGAVNDARDFFAEQGYACPDDYNPADHFIHTLFTKAEEDYGNPISRKICDQFTVSTYGKVMEKQLIVSEKTAFSNGNAKGVQLTSRTTRASWCVQLQVLVWRGYLDVFRNPSVATIRTIQKIFLAFVLGAFYYNLEKNQKGIMDAMGAIYLLITENTFPSMYGVLQTFPGELPMFHRENKNGLYRIDTYYISKMITLLPTFIIEPTLFIIITYWMIGLNNSVESFLITWALILLTANTASACGCCFSAMFDSVTLALLVLFPVDYLLMLGGGTFMVLNTIPSYLSWTQYLSWMRYANEGINIAVWKGVTNITCENGPEAPCIKTGEEVLNTLGFFSGNLQWAFLSLIGLYAFCHSLGFLFLLRQSRNN